MRSAEGLDAEKVMCVEVLVGTVNGGDEDRGWLRFGGNNGGYIALLSGLPQDVSVSLCLMSFSSIFPAVSNIFGEGYADGAFRWSLPSLISTSLATCQWEVKILHFSFWTPMHWMYQWTSCSSSVCAFVFPLIGPSRESFGFQRRFSDVPLGKYLSEISTLKGAICHFEGNILATDAKDSAAKVMSEIGPLQPERWNMAVLSMFRKKSPVQGGHLKNLPALRVWLSHALFAGSDVKLSSRLELSLSCFQFLTFLKILCRSVFWWFPCEFPVSIRRQFCFLLM